MYIPKHFEETDTSVLHELIKEHPLGAFVIGGATGLEANHIPFLVKPDCGPYGRLLGHVARANPIWRNGDAVDALIIFQGPHSVVSPSWYPTKKETGKVVPTWNYAVVHAHGTLRFIDDPEWLRDCLKELTDKHERERPIPWSMADAPPDYINRSISALIGVEMIVTRLEGKWKLSQNRPPKDIRGVTDGLVRSGGDDARSVAKMMHRDFDKNANAGKRST